MKLGSHVVEKQKQKILFLIFAGLFLQNFQQIHHFLIQTLFLLKMKLRAAFVNKNNN